MIWLTRLMGLVATATFAGPAVPQVMKELRKIESAQYRNGADLLRLEYQNDSAKSPSDPMPRVYAAWCSMVSDDAWNQLKNVAQLNPDNPWVHYGMGRVYTTWKMRDQARAEFDAVLKKDPRFSPAISGQADLVRGQKEWVTAEAKYREALAIDEDPQARAGLGLSLLGEGKTDEAKKELLAAVAGWPDQPAALNALMPMVIASKDPAALELTAHLADLKPRDRDIRRQLADLRFDAGDLPGAIADYEKLLKLGEPDVAVVRKLIAEYQRTHDVEHEQAMQVMLANLDREDPAPALRLAELKLAANDLEGAQAQYLAALERNPKRAETLVELAKLKLKTNAHFEAIERYRQAAKLEGPAAEQAKAELAKLEAEIKLAKRPAHGSVDAIYNSVASSLDALYAEHKRSNPPLAGELKLRVRVAADGQVQGIDVIGDTVGDPVLTSHAYFALRDAEFEKRKREPVFEFELGKKKK
jgi:tetratricopeptide (TPR) repeat protein